MINSVYVTLIAEAAELSTTSIEMGSGTIVNFDYTPDGTLAGIEVIDPVEVKVLATAMPDIDVSTPVAPPQPG